MVDWLGKYLHGRYRNAEIYVADTSQVNLDTVLQEQGVLQFYPEVVGIGMQIDVLGIVKVKPNVKPLLFFIEAKKTQLNTHDFGQILVYCRLCDPEAAFLFSSNGLGALSKIVTIREDITLYGDKKKLKMIQIGKWDVLRKAPDPKTIMPKLI